MTQEEALLEVNKIDAAALPVNVKTEFCKLWPTAKPILQGLEKFLPLLAVVIAGGDILSKKICPAPANQ